MQHHRYIQLLALGLIISLFCSLSCKRDKCKRIDCLNGNCLDGVCNCAEGYFQDDCGSVINAGFDATWNLEETCTAGSDNYPVTVAAVANSKTQLQMSGLWEQSAYVVVNIEANGLNLSVSRQPIGSTEVIAIGTINGARDEITLSYQVYNQGATQAFDVCSATLTKN